LSLDIFINFQKSFFDNLINNLKNRTTTISKSELEKIELSYIEKNASKTIENSDICYYQ
jgi:hypothetical protein